MKIYHVPTGKIFTHKAKEGWLEFLSIGDYGKKHNIKADFLGLNNEINEVKAKEIMPLTKKWVITISTQHTCQMNCHFCDCPKVKPLRDINISKENLEFQIRTAIKNEKILIGDYYERINVHYARMGEPTFNENVLDNAIDLPSIIGKATCYAVDIGTIHPVVSTMMPTKNERLYEFLTNWCLIKNKVYSGEAGLQISINTTDDETRMRQMGNNTMWLGKIAEICEKLPAPIGRKYTLNFAIADNTQINANDIKVLFDTDKFICKITPIHETKASKANKLTTTNGYTNYHPYKKTENDLKEAGFDVIVFIPSFDEDLSRITCGNAILSGSKIETKYKMEEVEDI